MLAGTVVPISAGPSTPVQEWPTLLDGHEVGSAGEQPQGVGVTQNAGSDVIGKAGCLPRGVPDVVAKPVLGDVAIGVDAAAAARVVLAQGAALGEGRTAGSQRQRPLV
jgi:hypothetical protein